MKNLVNSVMSILLITVSIILFNSASELKNQDLHRIRIVNSTYSCIIICNSQGVPIWVSDNIEDYFGWRVTDIQNKTIDVLMPDSKTVEQHKNKFKETVEQTKHEYLYGRTPTRRLIKVKCKDGSLKESAIRMFSADSYGEIYLYAVILPIDLIERLKDYPKAENLE